MPRERVAYLGNLKLLMVAAIIAVHGLIGFGDIEGAWPYQEVQEVQLTEASNIVLGMLLLPSLLFVMGLFLLISGLLTPGSLQRKGPGALAHDRLLRLGVPLAVRRTVLVRMVFPIEAGRRTRPNSGSGRHTSRCSAWASRQLATAGSIPCPSRSGAAAARLRCSGL